MRKSNKRIKRKSNRKTYRKRLNRKKINRKRSNRKKLYRRKKLSGGTEDEVMPVSFRIGLEIEGCINTPHHFFLCDIKNLDSLFGKKLTYFKGQFDASIKCKANYVLVDETIEKETIKSESSNIANSQIIDPWKIPCKRWEPLFPGDYLLQQFKEKYYLSYGDEEAKSKILEEAREYFFKHCARLRDHQRAHEKWKRFIKGLPEYDKKNEELVEGGGGFLVDLARSRLIKDLTWHAARDKRFFISDDSINQCSLELILDYDHVFTYDGKRIYMDRNHITSEILDEILIILSTMEGCQEGSCGFHVHISEIDPKYSLTKNDGKLFLLRALFLWSGFETSQNKSYQDLFLEKNYLRRDNDFAKMNPRLDKDEFLAKYTRAESDQLNNKELTDYLSLIFPEAGTPSMEGKSGLQYAFNIYFYGIVRKAGEDIDFEPPLRIEFRGYGDLLNMVQPQPSESQSPESIKALGMMSHPSTDKEQLKNRAKASRFYEYLDKYLKYIHTFFKEARESDSSIFTET